MLMIGGASGDWGDEWPQLLEMAILKFGDRAVFTVRLAVSCFELQLPNPTLLAQAIYNVHQKFSKWKVGLSRGGPNRFRGGSVITLRVTSRVVVWGGTITVQSSGHQKEIM